MARRYRSLHFGGMEGKNVVFHREHRSKRGRTQYPVRTMKPYERNGKKTQRFKKKLREEWEY